MPLHHNRRVFIAANDKVKKANERANEQKVNDGDDALFISRKETTNWMSLGERKAETN